jgi:diguanylate cyclase
MAESEDWRKKYKILAKELEQTEEYSGRLLEQLKNVLSQLSLGLQGQDSELDESLRALLSKLDTIEVRTLRNLTREIEKRIRVLDATRSNSVRQLVDILRQWSGLIEKQDVNGEFNQLLPEYNHQLESSAEHLYEIPGLLRKLLEYQKHLLLTVTPEERAEISNDLADNREFIVTAISGRLLDLVQLLRVPCEHASKVHELIGQLEANPASEKLPDILDNLVKLIRLSGMNMGEDFEDYLLSLNQQLAYVQTFLNESHDDELQASKRHNLLDKTVRHDVHQINRTVKQSTDINELKSAVSRQLVSIVRAMDEHKKSEEAREAKLTARYQDLLQKVAQMEKEADLVKHRIEEEQLKARTDPLTGLPNRYAYDRHILNELERWERYQTVFTLCVADLDLFKQVNDEYGHLAGDKVLRLMARILQQNLRNIDLVTRFGGEEFVIIMPSTDGPSAITAIEKVRKVIEESPFNFQSKPVRITMSFGVTEVQPGDTPETMFSRADKMLYQAKDTGRNRTLLG